MPRYIEDRGYFLEMPDDIPEEDDTNYLGDFKSYVTNKIEEVRMSVGDALERGDQADQKYGEGIKGDLNQFTDYVNTQFQDLNSGDEQKALGAMDEMASFFGPGDNGAQGAVAGIFIGPKGRKNLYGAGYNEAKNAERITTNNAKFADPAQAKDVTWQQYGVEQFRDGGIRSELPDTNAAINEDLVEYLDAISAMKPKGTTRVQSEERLGKVLGNHPDLFKAYPGLENVKVKIAYGEIPAGGRRGQYNLKQDTIELNGDNIEDMRSTLLHEIQHRIQFEEGWGIGTSSKGTKAWLQDYMQTRYDELNEKLGNVNPSSAEYTALVQKAENIKKKAKELSKFQGSDFELYKRFWGEVESRNVQRRDVLSKDDPDYLERVRPGKSAYMKQEEGVFITHPEAMKRF